MRLAAKDYINCAPLDALGAAPVYYRITFAPSNVFFDFLIATELPQAADEQLDRIGKTQYLYPIQGEPTLVEDSGGGRVAVIDVQARGEWTGAPLQTALQAVEDTYAPLTIVKCERRTVTTKDNAARPGSQVASGSTAAAEVSAYNEEHSFLATYKTAIIFTVLGLGAVALVIYLVRGGKIPTGGTS